jgi:hypothetical protein
MKYVLGIDVGGTKIAAGLVDQSFKVTKVCIVPTSQTDLLGQLARLIKTYKVYAAIGIGVPGTVAPSGMVHKLPNIKNFKPINLKKYLGNKFKVPISVINDAEAFAFAEAKLGSGRKFKKVFGVILGTGIGGGVVENSKHKDCGSILHRQLPDLEEKMQKKGRQANAKHYESLLVKLFPVVLKTFNPEIIIFGGARSQIFGMQAVLESCQKRFSNQKVIVKVSKLKHAGIIGAALPLLKK